MPLLMKRPLAITMWDFSWLERRWPGAGYEDWGRALDELVDRGYDAVRVDCYPHLLALDANALWTLKPVWHFCEWGSPFECDVRIMPALIEFLQACRDRGVRVGLSTWFRQDLADSRMAIDSPAALGAIWVRTLELIDAAGLLDAVLYVDLCNEWPGSRWAPFFVNDPPLPDWNPHTVKCQTWMAESIAVVRSRFPGVPMTFSFNPDVQTPTPLDYSFLDFFEPHLWMTQEVDFFEQAGYAFEAFDICGMENLGRNARRVYESDRPRWDANLARLIDSNAAYSRRTGLGLMTTECWAIVDYRDGPRFEWQWVKDLCQAGVERAAASGRWLAMATSNFCGPQFHGMWRDVAWHRRMTTTIKQSPIDADLLARHRADSPPEDEEPRHA
jgi:sugar phosphate isomerase/epimerase